MSVKSWIEENSFQVASLLHLEFKSTMKNSEEERCKT